MMMTASVSQAEPDYGDTTADQTLARHSVAGPLFEEELPYP
jgi:hypothetical protein